MSKYRNFLAGASAALISSAAQADLTILSCQDDYNGARGTITINERGTELIMEMPGTFGGTESLHYINGVNRSICQPCGLVGAVLGGGDEVQNIVEITSDKIVFGQRQGTVFTIDRNTGRMTPNKPLLSSSLCQSAARAIP